MALDPQRVLLRIAAELYYRSYCVKEHLRQIRLNEAPQYHQLACSITDGLNAYEQLLLRALETRTKLPPQDWEQAVYTELRYLSGCFRNLHELLVYFPLREVLPETKDILKIAFGEEFYRIDPSPLLGNSFNAYVFDFLEHLKNQFPVTTNIWPLDQRKTTLELAVCDRLCPTAWAVLAHELGHALDKTLSISSDVLRENEFSPKHECAGWAMEICADLIAAEFIGPAAILSIVSMEYCLLPMLKIVDPQSTHPLTTWRVRIVSEYLQSKYGSDHLANERSLFEEAWEYRFLRGQTAEDLEVYRKTDSLKYEKLVLPIATALQHKISQNLSSVHRIDSESLERCVLRLKRTLPISAQGASREDLREAILKYADTYGDPGSKSTHKKALAFKLLRIQFREDPLDAPMLLLSCHKRREELLDHGAHSLMLKPTSKRINQLCADLATVDRLGVHSIRANVVQRGMAQQIVTRRGLDL